MQEFIWPVLDPSPRASPKFQLTLMAGNHQSKFWKIFTDFPQIMMAFSTVYTRIQFFFHPPRLRSTQRIRRCFIYFYLGPLDKWSSFLNQNPYQNKQDEWSTPIICTWQITCIPKTLITWKLFLNISLSF